MQAIRSTRPGGHVGYVGVSHDVALPGDELFFSHVHLHGGPAPVRRFLPDLMDRIWNRTIRPRQGLRPGTPARRGRRGLPGHGLARGHQGSAAPMTDDDNDQPCRTWATARTASTWVTSAGDVGRRRSEPRPELTVRARRHSGAC